MAVGAFGPWAKAVGFVGVTVSGTDGGNDGWIVLAAAVLGASAFVAYHRGYRISALIACLAGMGSAVMTIGDRRNLSTSINTDSDGLISVGWGLNLAMVASLALAAIGLTAFVFWETRPSARQDEPHAPTPPTSVSRPAASKPSTVEEMERLADLRTRGMLTDDEFSRAKERLLEQPPE